MTRIAAVIIIKNESQRIVKTIKSVQHLDGIVLYDTGRDDTVEIVKQESTIPVHVSHGEFIDCSTSKNAAIAFADTLDYDYYFMLEANDELMGIKPMVDNDNQTAWYVEQRVKHTAEESPEEYISCKTIGFIKSKSNLHYVGSIYEYLQGYEDVSSVLKNVYIFQDKSNRDTFIDTWHTNVDMLEQELIKYPNNPRFTFYLAQNLQCLGEFDKAYKLYAEREAMSDDNEEEKFAACQQLGQIAVQFNHLDVACQWFLKAFRHSDTINQPRAEPLVCLAQIEIFNNQKRLAYAYIYMACSLKYPINALMGVNPKCYTHTRWEVYKELMQ
jgi:tetratricopeptide (TPR) repeat protein